MRDYGKPASNQLQIDGLGTKGEELMQEAREWADEHVFEFRYYKELALEECQRSKRGVASSKFCLEMVRHRYKVSIPNAYSAPLSRIAMEQNPAIKFRTAKSMVDGFTEVTL